MQVRRRGAAVLTALAVLVASLVLLAPSPASADPVFTWTPAAQQLPDAEVGTAYSSTTTASSPEAVGPLTYQWSGLDISALQSIGFSFSTSGVLSGTPTSTGGSGGSGAFELVVTVTDANGATGSHTYWLDTYDHLPVYDAPTITTTSLPQASADPDDPYYSARVQSTGDPRRTSAVSDGSLPGGLELQSDGLILGQPAVSGTFTFEVTVTDRQGRTASRTFDLLVTPPRTYDPPAITTVSLHDAEDRAPYSVELSHAGDPRSTWSISSGSLPVGLTLFPAGSISGIPASAGTSTFEATVTDRLGRTGSRTFVLVVQPAPEYPLYQIPYQELRHARIGVDYSPHRFTWGGDPYPSWSITSGSLPPGMQLTPTGYLSGTPTAVGSFTFEVTVTDRHDHAASRTFDLVVEPPLVITTTSVPEAQIGLPYDAVLDIAGDMPMVSTWFYVDGAMPPGLGYRNNHIIGTPTASGTFTFTSRLQDADGATALLHLTMTVHPPILPDAPRFLSAGPSDRSAVVAWQAPTFDGGTPVTAYEVRAYLDGTLVDTRTVAATATIATQQQFRFGGLLGNRSYTFRVAATNAVGTGTQAAATDPVVTFVLPDAVPKPVAVARSTSATVTWQAAADNGVPILAYRVRAYRGLNTVSWQDVSSDDRSLLVSDLMAGQAHTFTVTPVVTDHDAYESDPSDPVLPTVGPPAPIWAAPVPAATSVKVSWSVPYSGDEGITSYALAVAVDGVAQPVVSLPNNAGTSRTFTGLTTGSTYTYRLAGVSAHGQGDWSDPLVVVAGSPTAPGFQSAQPGNASAKVGWAAPTNNGSAVTGYVVTPYLHGTALPSQTFGATTSAVVTGLANGQRYTFRVAATNARGLGPRSTATNSVVVGAPTSPGFFNPVPGTTSVRMSWAPSTANGAPILGYRITPLRYGWDPQPVVEFRSTSNVQTVTGLEANTTYAFKVTAFNAFGESPAAQVASVIVGSPAPPGFQSASSAGVGSARVQFTVPAANSAPITGYYVWPVLNGVVQPAHTFFTPSATSLTLTGLTNGATYAFRVAAFNSVGTGPYALTNTVVTGTPTAPGFPSAQPGNGTAKVAWSASVDNGSPITAYKVTPYVGSVAQATRTFTGTATSATVTGLTNGTTYTFKVSAVNAVGTGLPATTTLATKVGTPTTPVFPSAKPGSATATVSAGAPAANASAITSYVVTPMVGTTARPSQTFTGTATSWNVTGLTNGTTYTFRVSAINAIGTGPYATTAAIKVGVPGQPTGVVAAAGAQQATVSWVAPAANGGPLTGYVVTPYIGSVAQPARLFDASATSRAITGLATGTAYTFKVQAVNAIGTGAASSASAAVVPT